MDCRGLRGTAPTLTLNLHDRNSGAVLLSNDMAKQKGNGGRDSGRVKPARSAWIKG